MNLDKKLELAHEWAMELISKDKDVFYASNMVSYNAWQYADAMEAEYNKRKQAEAEKNAKQSEILFEQLTKNNDGSCAHLHTTLNKTECFDCGSKLQDEFQIDWSVAPDDAVAWVYSNIDRSGFWCHKSPVKLSRGWCTSTMLNKAPSFNYQGDWKDSLRNRP